MRFGMRALLLAVLLIAFAIQGTRVLLDYLHESKRAELKKLGTGHAFLIHEGEFLLLREGTAFGAFIPKSQGRNGELVEYDWYFRNDGKGTFDPNDAAVQHGKGVSKQPTTDINVMFGPFALQWSGCDKGWGWIYYQPSGSKAATLNPTSRFCVVRRADLSEIDAASPSRIYVAHGDDSGIRGDEAFEPGPAPSGEITNSNSSPSPTMMQPPEWNIANP